MIGIIFSQLGRHIREYFKTRALPKAATILGFILVFAFVMVGTYEVLSHGFAYIASNAFFGNAVSLYLYEMILLVVVALSVATALIEGTFSLFRDSSDTWILATPGYKKIPGMVLAETISGGAFLPLSILTIPTLAAMQAVYHIGIVGFVLGLIAILLIVASSVLATFLLLFLVTKLLSYVNLARLSLVLSVMVLLVVIVAGSVWHVVGSEGATLLFPDFDATTHAADTHTVISLFEFLPSHPAALVLYDVQQGVLLGATEETGLLITLALVLYALYTAVSVWYLPLWQELQAEPQPEHAQGSDGSMPQAFPRFFKSPMGALFEKELLVIVRTGRDFMWLLFMLALWLLQIGTDLYIKKISGGTALGTFPLIIQALEVSVIAYFLGAFTLRFAFPTFSMESSTAWIVNGSPLSLRRIYTSKLIFFCAFFGALSVIVALLHSFLLSLSAASSVGLVAMSFVMGLTITIVSMLFGILYPNFETTNPQELSTSLPGLTLVFLVLIYGALGSYAFLSLLKMGDISRVLTFILVSVVLAAIAILASLNRLKTFEFVPEID